MTLAATYQPKPKPGSKVVIDVVLADIRERAEFGLKKYGTYLQAGNGRDALWDAYQEAIDLVMYLRQKIMEQEMRTVNIIVFDTGTQRSVLVQIGLLPPDLQEKLTPFIGKTVIWNGDKFMEAEVKS